MYIKITIFVIFVSGWDYSMIKRRNIAYWQWSYFFQCPCFSPLCVLAHSGLKQRFCGHRVIIQELKVSGTRLWAVQKCIDKLNWKKRQSRKFDFSWGAWGQISKFSIFGQKVPKRAKVNGKIVQMSEMHVLLWPLCQNKQKTEKKHFYLHFSPFLAHKRSKKGDFWLSEKSEKPRYYGCHLPFDLKMICVWAYLQRLACC